MTTTPATLQPPPPGPPPPQKPFEQHHTLASSAVGPSSSKQLAATTTPQQRQQEESVKVATIYLYLIRHGEAAHNILEKAAKKQALEECLAEGLTEDDPITKDRIEKARKAVLNNESLKDARLSPAGRQQAIEARHRLEQILSETEIIDTDDDETQELV